MLREVNMTNEEKAFYDAAVKDIQTSGKVCGSCKKMHYSVPKNHKHTVDNTMEAIWFDCECKSTLFKLCRLKDKKVN